MDGIEILIRSLYDNYNSRMKSAVVRFLEYNSLNTRDIAHALNVSLNEVLEYRERNKQWKLIVKYDEYENMMYYEMVLGTHENE
ncbi:MAG: hypothetical protein GY853_16650 [PVC group bacterium]|nr:hypothetical protein [PVC group bacterium]